MIPVSDLRRLARARLRDAKVLFRGKRYDAAGYICGYAVEIALKARICRTVRWTSFPQTAREFAGYQSYRTHVLEYLLAMSGQQPRIRAKYAAAWSRVADWSPEMRYLPVGTAAEADVRTMIEAVTVLVRIL